MNALHAVTRLAFVFFLTSLEFSAQATKTSEVEQELERFITGTRAQAEQRWAIGAEVEKLFRDDQAQGSPESMSEAQRRSWETAHERRVLRMREIVRTTPLETIPDLYNAGMLLHHGIAPEDFLTAHVLFSTAALKGSLSARWAAAAALDRYLGWTGRPFIFSPRPGQPNLITDKIRKFHCMLPVAEQVADSPNIPRECTPTLTDMYNDGRPNELPAPLSDR